MTTDPKGDPNTDPKGDPKGDPNTDPKGDPNTDPKGDPVENPEGVLAKNKELLGKIKDRDEKLAAFEKAEEERRQAALTEHEKALEDAKKAGYTEAQDVYGTQLLKQQLVTRSVNILIDPSDAALLIDIADIDQSNPENVVKQIDEAIAELVKSKPHLAVGKRSPRDINQGYQGGAGAGRTADDWLRGVVGG